MLYPNNNDGVGVGFVYDKLGKYVGKFNNEFTTYGAVSGLRKGPDGRIYAVSKKKDPGSYAYKPWFLTVYDQNGILLKSVDLLQRNTTVSTSYDITLKAGATPTAFCDVYIGLYMQKLSTVTTDVNMNTKPKEVPARFNILQIINLNTPTPIVYATDLYAHKVLVIYDGTEVASETPLPMGGFKMILGFEYIPLVIKPSYDCFSIVYKGMDVGGNDLSGMTILCLKKVINTAYSPLVSNMYVHKSYWPNMYIADDFSDVFYKSSSIIDMRQVRYRFGTFTLYLTPIQSLSTLYLPPIQSLSISLYLLNR